jgi:hypothetical protein
MLGMTKPAHCTHVVPFQILKKRKERELVNGPAFPD